MKSLKHLASTSLTCLALATLGTSANAQAVYRCGNSYSQTPCAGGTAVAADDARSDAQRVAAQQGLARDKELARDMEASRHKDEARELALLKGAQTEQARKASHKKAEEKKAREPKASKKSAGLRTVKVQEPGTFTAIADSGAPKKTKTPRSAP